MPITNSYDPDTPAVISPGQMVRPVAGFPHTLIVTFQPRTFATFVEQYEPSPLADIAIEESLGMSSPGAHSQVQVFSYAGQTLGAYLSPVGAAPAVATMEKAIALGATRFVVFGTCGILAGAPGADTLIVPTAAYRDEGTSYHYAPAADYAEVGSAGATAAVLDELAIPYLLGRVWTTDGLFRETRANLDKRVRDGCVAVDMETSALAALAGFRGVAVHQFLYAGDALSGDDWDPGTLGTLPPGPRARYFRIAAEIAVRLGPFTG